MSIGSERGPRPRQVVVLLVLAGTAAALWSGCHVSPPALFPSPGGIDAATPVGVLDIARRQDYDVSHGVGDYRRLATGCPACTYGPHVFLHPVRGAWRFDSTMLAEGRFLARLINMDADPYPKFNLAPHDTVYWWVDKKGPGNTWRNVYVSSSPRVAFTRDTLFKRDPHVAAARWERTIARFLWQDRDEALWVACDMTGCCRSSGADLY